MDCGALIYAAWILLDCPNLCRMQLLPKSGSHAELCWKSPPSSSWNLCGKDSFHFSDEIRREENRYGLYSR